MTLLIPLGLELYKSVVPISFRRLSCKVYLVLEFLAYPKESFAMGQTLLRTRNRAMHRQARLCEKVLLQGQVTFELASWPLH